MNRAAIKVWDFVEGAHRSLQIEHLVKTLTQDRRQQVQKECSGCGLEDESCNCTFKDILSENTFNVDIMIATNRTGFHQWCPTRTVTSDFFQCGGSHSVPTKVLCDGYRDCPNNEDESLLMCTHKEYSLAIPMLSCYVVSFGLVLCFALRRSLNICENHEPEAQTSSTTIYKLLGSLRDFCAKQTKQSEDRLAKSLRRADLRAKIQLLEIVHNIESSRGLMKVAVQKIFSSTTERKALFLLVKNSTMPTAFKTGIIEMYNMNTMMKLKIKLGECLSAKSKVHIETFYGIVTKIFSILLLPLHDIKTVVTISTLVNFHYVVIQQRLSLIDNLPLHHIITLLILIYILGHLLKILTASRLETETQESWCNLRWIPFYAEIYLIIIEIRSTWRIRSLKLDLFHTLHEVEVSSREPHSTFWAEVERKSRSVNRICVQLENQGTAQRKVQITTVLVDIVQGAVLLLLVLRADLRIRGTLRLAQLAGWLGADTRDSEIPGLNCLFFFF